MERKANKIICILTISEFFEHVKMDRLGEEKLKRKNMFYFFLSSVAPLNGTREDFRTLLNYNICRMCKKVMPGFNSYKS
jgi:hypothetical protein